MRVYRLRSDVKYQYFLAEHEEDSLRFQMNCTPRAEDWSPPPVFIYEPTLRQGDFYQFDRSALITSPRATDALRAFLEMAGELLPLPYQGQEFTLLNILECINCLDREKAVWAENPWTGARTYPEKYVVHRNRFSESVLFKIPETRASEVLLLEGWEDTDVEEEFREVVEAAGLKSLTVETLWSDEE